MDDNKKDINNIPLSELFKNPPSFNLDNIIPKVNDINKGYNQSYEGSYNPYSFEYIIDELIKIFIPEYKIDIFFEDDIYSDSFRVYGCFSPKELREKINLQFSELIDKFIFHAAKFDNSYDISLLYSDLNTLYEFFEEKFFDWDNNTFPIEVLDFDNCNKPPTASEKEYILTHTSSYAIILYEKYTLLYYCCRILETYINNIIVTNNSNEKLLSSQIKSLKILMSVILKSKSFKSIQHYSINQLFVIYKKNPDIYITRTPTKTLSFKYKNIESNIGLGKFKNFYKSLCSSGFIIESETINRVFNTAFSDSEISNKIIWHHGIQSLNYLIKNLYKRKLLDTPKNSKLRLMEKCFLSYNNPDYDFSKIKGLKDPKDNELIKNLSSALKELR
ncbi:MAG: hypothetical protein ACOYOV_11255 [Bacteroidales bacterium]